MICVFGVVCHDMCARSCVPNLCARSCVLLSVCSELSALICVLRAVCPELCARSCVP